MNHQISSICPYGLPEIAFVASVLFFPRSSFVVDLKGQSMLPVRHKISINLQGGEKSKHPTVRGKFQICLEACCTGEFNELASNSKFSCRNSLKKLAICAAWPHLWSLESLWCAWPRLRDAETKPVRDPIQTRNPKTP